jgi:hypothetical protein
MRRREADGTRQQSPDNSNSHDGPDRRAFDRERRARPRQQERRAIQTGLRDDEPDRRQPSCGTKHETTSNDDREADDAGPNRGLRRIGRRKETDGRVPRGGSSQSRQQPKDKVRFD